MSFFPYICPTLYTEYALWEKKYFNFHCIMEDNQCLTGKNIV